MQGQLNASNVDILNRIRKSASLEYKDRVPVATQANLAVLKSRGAFVVEPGEGGLACGTTGRGRMPEPLEIFNATRAVLASAGN